MTVHFVTSDQLGGHTRRQCPIQHYLGQLRFGLELDRRGNPRRLTVVLVRQPRLRQRQLRSSQVRPLGLAYGRNTPIWQLSILPAVLEYWLLSTMQNAPTGSERKRTHPSP